MRKISDILREAREEKDLSLDKVSEDTKIKKEFLKKIEEGRFQKLPSESYALGFVKNYAKYLNIYNASTTPLFRREYKSSRQIPILPEFRKSQHKFSKGIFLSSKFFLALIVFFVVLLYIFFQYSSVIFPPPLRIEKPKPEQEIIGNVVEVVGRTDPYATVLIDGAEAYVDLAGNFKKSIFAFSGEKKIEIVAKNRLGKETKKEIKVHVR